MIYSQPNANKFQNQEFQCISSTLMKVGIPAQTWPTNSNLIFLLCALIVPHERWQHLEQDLEQAIVDLIPEIGTDIEIHYADLRSGRSHFRQIRVEKRIAFRNRWLSIAAEHDLHVVYRAIEKRRFHAWLVRTFGSGVLINPHVAAFALVSRVVNDFLAGLQPSSLGIFISDDNKEVVKDIEKSLKVLRGIENELRLGQVIEKGFFIDSSKSRVIQLCDVCALAARKKEERKLGLPPKTIDDSAIELLDPLIHRGDERLLDVVKWIEEQQHSQ
jgi:hypothetical protein